MHIICLCRYGVSGFPTLKFFPKGNKAGEDYDGGRDLDDFVTFINEKCGTSRDGKGQLTSKVSGIIVPIVHNRKLQIILTVSIFVQCRLV